MNDKNYFKITEGGETVCFSTEMFRNSTAVIAMLNDAISTGSEGAQLKDYILLHSGKLTPMDIHEWENKEVAQKEPSPYERTVSIDLDYDHVAFSDWNGGVRTMLSGKIFRLTGCYEMALTENGLDADSFVANLLHHCELKCVKPLTVPVFGEMQM